jgi:sulfite exporter TauE/SafE
MALGATAGGIGQALDLAGSALGMSRAAAVVAGTLMLAWGTLLLLEAAGVRVRRWLPRGLGERAGALLARLRGQPPRLRSLLIGLSSTLLPCGWLYAFVVTAAGTGSAMSGALLMFTFWLGTLPVLVGVGVGVQRFATKLRRHLPLVTALALVAMGGFSLIRRVDLTSATSEPTCCHHPRP